MLLLYHLVTAVATTVVGGVSDLEFNALAYTQQLCS